MGLEYEREEGEFSKEDKASEGEESVAQQGSSVALSPACAMSLTEAFSCVIFEAVKGRGLGELHSRCGWTPQEEAAQNSSVLAHTQGTGSCSHPPALGSLLPAPCSLAQHCLQHR